MKEEVIQELIKQGGKTFEEVIAWEMFISTVGMWIGAVMFISALACFAYYWISNNLNVFWIEIMPPIFVSMFVFGALFFTMGLLQKKKCEVAPRAVFINRIGG